MEYRKRGANESNNNSAEENLPPGVRKVLKRVMIGRKSSAKKPLWCGRTTKRRFKVIEVYIDEHGNEIHDPNAPKDTRETEGETEGSSTEEEEKGDDENKPRSSPRNCAISPRGTFKHSEP